MESDNKKAAPDAMLTGEHEVQVRLLEAVETLLGEQERAKELDDALDQLIDYTEVHFLSEQLLMRLYAYPQQGAHERRHLRLLEQARELRRDLGAGEPGVPTALAARLRRSILDHIASEDAAFSKYLAGTSQGSEASRRERPQPS